MQIRRYQRGVANHKSKLDEGMVRFIRASELKGRELAARFNVTPAAISLVRTRKVWSHVA